MSGHQGQCTPNTPHWDSEALVYQKGVVQFLKHLYFCDSQNFLIQLILESECWDLRRVATIGMRRDTCLGCIKFVAEVGNPSGYTIPLDMTAPDALSGRTDRLSDSRTRTNVDTRPRPRPVAVGRSKGEKRRGERQKAPTGVFPSFPRSSKEQHNGSTV